MQDVLTREHTTQLQAFARIRASAEFDQRFALLSAGFGGVAPTEELDFVAHRAREDADRPASDVLHWYAGL